MENNVLTVKGDYEWLYIHHYCGMYLVYKRDYNFNELKFLCAINNKDVVRDMLYKYGVERFPTKNGIIED